MLLEWLERRTKSAYLKLLEDELARLREENRQLINSILASHGMPGIDLPRKEKNFVPLKRPNWLDLRRKLERRAANPQASGESPSNAHRSAGNAA